jgi:hypothetical protein
VESSAEIEQSAISLQHIHDSISVQRMVDERMKQIENRISSSIAQMFEMNANRGKMKGTGRGKRSKPPTNDFPEQSTSKGAKSNQSRGSSRGRRSYRGSRGSLSTPNEITQAATQRLNDFIGEEDLQDANNSDIFTEDASLTGETKTVYIQKVDCQFNGNSLDSIEDKSTEDESMQQFWRLYYFNGQLNSLFSNGLTYNDFR